MGWLGGVEEHLVVFAFTNTWFVHSARANVGDLVAEAVDGAALAFEGVDHVQRGDRLAAGVLRVGHGVPHDVLDELLDHAAGFLVDEARDPLHPAPAREAPDGGLGDALDGVLEDLTETLGTSLSEPLTSLTAADGHCWCFYGGCWVV